MSNRIGDILIRIIMTVCYIASYPVYIKWFAGIGINKAGNQYSLTADSGINPYFRASSAGSSIDSKY